MCEVAMMVTPQNQPDPVLAMQAYGNGEIIEVLPDGAQWGTKDLARTDIRILKMPGVPESEYNDCMQPVDDDKGLVAKRALRVAYETIPVVQARVSSEPSPLTLTPVESAQFSAAKQTKNVGQVVIGA